MYTNISFPSFGIDINPPRSISLGPLTIHFYGLIIAFGLVLAVIYCCKRSKEFGVKEDDLIDGVLWVTPFAILCARAYYVIFSWESYAADPIKALYIWEGGLAIYGGVLGAVLGMYVFCKFKKLKFATILDMVLLGFLIGQSIGRWGNFFNREAFGAETDFFLRMGLLSTETGKVTFHHPTFLYESVWNAVGFGILHFLSKRRKYDGQIALGYVVWYGLGRAFIEGLRTDSLYWGPFRVSQLLAAVSCLAAAVVLLILSGRVHKPENLLVNQIAAAEAAKKAEEEEKSAEEGTEEKTEEATEETSEEATAEETEAVAEEAAEEAAEETEAAPEEKPEEK